jgi:cytochrome c oxidase accessory protein FixG
MKEAIATEDVLSRREQRESPLYAGRVKVYPKSVRGAFRTIKWAVLIVLLGIYYLVPWIRWDRGPGLPDQAVLADFVTRRIYFFGIEIWPQEIYFLTGLLVLGAFGLFLVTALFGRVWCGFTCPQTVWTDLYMWVERLVEGDRAERIRLDKSPWTPRKVALKTVKHALWLLIAMATGGAWIMYFNDAPTVTVGILTGQASVTQYFFFGLFTTTTYLLAGIAREQVCTYMCPWPRIQGALVDQDTLAVTYERWRGEPRGPIRKGRTERTFGDCIDCKQCVAVCPMGIDIRDGFQLECIGCALCIDACNEVMDRIGRERWLISYDSERNIELREQGQVPRYRLVRPRTILYASILAVVGALMLAVLLLRSDAHVNVLHDRNPLFVQLSDGSIRNGYTLKIVNKRHEPRTLLVTQEAFPEGRLSAIGGAAGERQNAPALELPVPPDGVAEHRIFLTVPRDAIPASSVDLRFLFTDPATGQSFEAATIFRAPGREG